MSAGASGLRLGRARFRSLGLGLVVLLGFLFVAALVIGWSARVAQACDPVTGQGCDTTPSTAAAPPSTAEPAPPQGGTRSPSDNGQPFIAPTSAPAAAPTTTLAPATPTTASTPADQTSGSSGGFPWDWVLGGGGAVAVAGTAAAGVAVRSRTKPDPLGDFSRACNDLCFAKQQEAQAEADIQAAQAELAQIDQAYFTALDYLDNQLRQQYLNLRSIHFVAAGMLALLPAVATVLSGGWLLGAPASWAMGAGIGLNQGLDTFDPSVWNTRVNEAMRSAHGEIDRIHDENRAPWQAKLDDARRRQNEASPSVWGNDLKLAELRAANPDVQFPACGCE